MAEGGSDCPDKAVPASPSPPAKVTVQLFDRALWSSLAKQCNEMEVSGSLRKLVPELIIKVSGLVEEQEYTLSVMFVPTDDVYYLYEDNTWAPGGVFVEEHRATVYSHPNGKMTGREWSSHFIKFPDLRLTTDPNAVPPKMFVDQRRYYQTVIVFTGSDGTWVLKLPELRFMAVPSIHNPHVKELKARRSEEPPPKTRRVSRKASDGASSSRTPSQRTQSQEGQHPSGKNIPTLTPQSDSGASDVSSPMLALSGRQPAGTSSIPPISFFLTPRDVPRDLRPSTSAHAVTSFIQTPPPARGPSHLFRDHRPGIASLSAYCRTSCIQSLPLVITSSEVYCGLGAQTAPFSAQDRTSCIQPASGLASSDQSRDVEPLTDPFSAHARASCAISPPRVSGDLPRDLEPPTDPFAALARTSCIPPTPSALALSNVFRDPDPRTDPFSAHNRASCILPPFPALISRDVFPDLGPQTDPLAAHARTSCTMSPPRASGYLPRDLGPRAEPFSVQPTTVTSYPGYVREYEKCFTVSSTTDSTEHAPQLPSFGLEYAAGEETRSLVEVPVEMAASRGPTSEESHSQLATACAHDGGPSHVSLAGSSQAFAQHPGALDLVVSELWDEEDYIPETDHNKEP